MYNVPLIYYACAIGMGYTCWEGQPAMAVVLCHCCFTQTLLRVIVYVLDIVTCSSRDKKHQTPMRQAIVQLTYWVHAGVPHPVAKIAIGNC